MQFGKKLMVKVSYLGGLGNNLWQYSAGRILSEKLGVAFKAPPINDLPNLETNIKGKRFWVRRKIIQGHFVPDDCARKFVHIKSGLERYENIAGRQMDIRSWINIPKKSERNSVSNTDSTSSIANTNGLPRTLSRWRLM